MSYLCHTIINYFSPEINISGIETDINIKLTALFLAHMKQVVLSDLVQPWYYSAPALVISVQYFIIYFYQAECWIFLYMSDFQLVTFLFSSKRPFLSASYWPVQLKKKKSNFKSHSTCWASELNLWSKKRNCWKTRAYCANPFSDVNNRTLFFLFQLKRELQQTYVINVVVRTHKTDIQI